MLTAPGEKASIALLTRLDREMFRPSSDTARDGANNGRPDTVRPPLEGRKLHVHVDWSGDTLAG